MFRGHDAREATEHRERAARLDRLALARRVRELEERIRRLAVARWSMPEVQPGSDARRLVRDIAARAGFGERLGGREDEARAELARAQEHVVAGPGA